MPISRKTALSIGGLVTAATLVTGAGAGVASAATTTPQAKANHDHPRIDRVVKRESKAAVRFDKVVARLEARAPKLATRVHAMPAGAARTEALAKLADLATRAAAVKAADAKVVTALKAVKATDVTAAQTTLKTERAALKAVHVQVGAARRDIATIVHDLPKR